MPGSKLFRPPLVADVLYKLATALASDLELNELYRKIVHIGCELANTSHGFIYVVNKEQDLLELKFGTGIYTHYLGVARSKEEPSVSSVVWKTGRLLVVGDLAQWDGRAKDRPYGEEVVKSVLGIPLRSGYEVIAVIGLGFEALKGELAEEQIDLLSRFATLASLALNNARLFNDLHAELLAQKQINNEQHEIMEKQIQLYSQEINFAQRPVMPMEGAPMETEHHLLARRLRKTMLLHLADIYQRTGRMKAHLENKTQIQTLDSLTSREQAVLNLMAAGLSNYEIANDIGITINTVKTHINRIFAKLGVKSRVQAIIKAKDSGLV